MLDPSVVRDFAKFIIAKKESIEESVARLDNYSQRLEQNWQDRQNHIFRENFVPHMQKIKKLAELLESHAVYCNQAAQLIEEYNQS